MRREGPGRTRAGVDENPGPARPATEPDHSALPHHAANQLAALAAQAADAPTGMIQLVDGDRVVLTGGYGVSAGWAHRSDAPLADTLAGVVLRTRAALVIADLAHDDRVPPDSPSLVGGAGAFAGFPVTDGDGAVVGVCCVTDVVARQWSPGQLAAVERAAQVCASFVSERLARLQVDRQRRFLDAVLDSLHDGVAACDADGRPVIVNSRMQRLRPALQGQPTITAPAACEGLHHLDGRPVTPQDAPLSRALRGERIRGDHVVVRPAGGRSRVCLVDGQPIVGPDGRSMGAVIALQDITERRRAERFRTCELAVTRALAEATSAEEAGPRVLEAFVDTMGWAHGELWLVEPSGEALRPAARWSAPDRTGEMDLPDRLPFGRGLAGRAWQAGKPLWIRDIGNPQSLISPEAARASRLHTALAIPVRSGPDLLGVLTFFADVAEDPEHAVVSLLSGMGAHIGQFLAHRHVADLRLQLARSKDDYLALVGHELRTPLTSIAAYTGLLREADPSTLAGDGQAMLAVIERNTNHLRAIIDDLLELSALDTGHANVAATPCDLVTVVRDAVDAATTELAHSPVTLAVDLPAELVVHGDCTRLRQVVDNLLSNAIKYSPDGGHIGVQLRQLDGTTAELCVADNGIGIPPEERDRLFSRLHRTSSARERGIPGTGLGLALVRAIVERHHGTIMLVAQHEPGTRIQVRLPLSAH